MLVLLYYKYRNKGNVMNNFDLDLNFHSILIEYTKLDYPSLELDGIIRVLDERLVDLENWIDIDLQDFENLDFEETSLIELIINSYTNFRELGFNHEEAIDLCTKKAIDQNYL